MWETERVLTFRFGGYSLGQKCSPSFLLLLSLPSPAELRALLQLLFLLFLLLVTLSEPPSGRDPIGMVIFDHLARWRETTVMSHLLNSPSASLLSFLLSTIDSPIE